MSHVTSLSHEPRRRGDAEDRSSKVLARSHFVTSAVLISEECAGHALLSRVTPSLLAAAVLLAILIAIYGPGIGKGFVKDDVVWVGNNHVTSWADVRALLVRTDGFYRPLVAATFAIDRAVYGVEPFGFGVTNLSLLLLGAGRARVSGQRHSVFGPTTAVMAAGVWALNFHAVNMAVLWLSGRTALCVVIAALLAAAAVVEGQPIAAGVAALLAMIARKSGDAPVILSGWAWVLARRTIDARVAVDAFDVVRLTWPTWIAGGDLPRASRADGGDDADDGAGVVPVRAGAGRARGQRARVSGSGLHVLRDRGDRRASGRVAASGDDAGDRSACAILGAIWFVGTFALTIFVPNRSSLYALLPSVAPALVGWISVAAALGRVEPRWTSEERH